MDMENMHGVPERHRNWKNVPLRNRSLPKVEASSSLSQLPLQRGHHQVTLKPPIRYSHGRLHFGSQWDDARYFVDSPHRAILPRVVMPRAQHCQHLLPSVLQRWHWALHWGETSPLPLLISLQACTPDPPGDLDSCQCSFTIPCFL